MYRYRHTATMLCGVLFMACGARAEAGVVGRIPVDDGPWDFASVDAAASRLYVARADNVTVVDLDARKALPSIGSIVRGHAVVRIPDTSTLMITSGRDNSVRFVDVGNGREIGRVAVGNGPDGAFYAPDLKLAVVMNSKDGTVSIIDAAAMKVVRTIALKPGLEYPRQGPGTTLFVNNEDASELETADLVSGRVGPAIPLTGCEGPTGLAFDSKTNLLISACANGKAAVVDAQTRRLVKLLDIGRGPDDVILDAARRRAYIPCGKDGTLTVVALDGADAPRVVRTIHTEKGARTGALDPRSGLLYLPTADFGPPSSGSKPQPIPGSFRVLVVDPS
jgi:DNA-binding beta-propeller fold protein YncE